MLQTAMRCLSLLLKSVARSASMVNSSASAAAVCVTEPSKHILPAVPDKAACQTVLI